MSMQGRGAVRLARVTVGFFRAFAAVMVASLVALAALTPDARAATIQYVYDELGRVTALIDPDGDTTEYAYDDAGNILSVSRRATVTLAIVSFSPASGPVGASVTLVGAGFDTTPANNTVKFNGTAATVVSATATQLSTTVPTGATTGLVSVSNSRGSASSAAPFTVTLAQPPTIVSFAPVIGVPGGSVTITGTNFAASPAGNEVRINQAGATVQSAAADSLVATIPSASGGRIRVTTATGVATSANDLFIAPAPHAAAAIGSTSRVVPDGAAASVTLAATRVGLVLFDGTAGEGHRVLVNNAAFQFGATGVITVYKPDGTVLATSPSFTTTATLVLPALPENGTYSILLVPSSGRSGSASISVVQDVYQPLELGTPFDFNVDVHYRQGRFPFPGVAGVRYTLVLSGVTLPSGGTFVMRSPSGSQMFTPAPFGPAGGGLKLPGLPSTGTHTIEIVPGGGTGKVTLLLQELPDVDVGTLQIGVPATVAFVSGGQVARATFPGTALEILGVAVQNVGIESGSLRIYRPDSGNFLFPTNFSEAGYGARLPLIPQTGLYTIEITSAGAPAGTVLLTAWRDVAATAAIDGPPVGFALPYPGQAAKFTFTAAAGDNLSLEWNNIVMPSAALFNIVSPTGSTLVGNTAVNAAGLVYDIPALSLAGTYTINFTPRFSGTGSGALTLRRDP